MVGQDLSSTSHAVMHASSTYHAPSPPIRTITPTSLGHGKSEPREEKWKAYVDRFEDLVDDASQFLDSILAKHLGLPVILAGHSLGGLVAVHLLAR